MAKQDGVTLAHPDYSLHWRGESHSEIVEMLKRSGIPEPIDYKQNIYMNFNVDMTVGRYMWHDDSGTKRFLFVLESYGN